MYNLLKNLREAQKLLSWYEHQRSQRICELEPILIKEYHQKCNSTKYTELERASFSLEFPEYIDYRRIKLLTDDEMIIHNKAIDYLEYHIDCLKTSINKSYNNFQLSEREQYDTSELHK